jgi:tRNA U34 2-thiouridine synthase MnmA/TrmU
MTKAIALLSGGLDSTLAILAVLKQGIAVRALQFSTGFESDASKKSMELHDSKRTGEKFGFDVEVKALGQKFIEVLCNPKHGYGKNMNPCIDCRILMLREAKHIMDSDKADFIITGEVLGQRPMSQRKDTLYHIDKEADLTGYVLRPLSAKLLRETYPETEGLIDREKLFDFSGRSRKPQIALAEEFRLTEYPAPAGGCLLTEQIFSMRLKDLLEHTSSPTQREFELLKTGRHFRFSSSSKIIIGRNRLENDVIESLSATDDAMLTVKGYGSPMTLLIGEISDEALRNAASLCARYSDAKHLNEVDVSILHGKKHSCITVRPADSERIDAQRIERTSAKNFTA